MASIGSTAAVEVISLRLDSIATIEQKIADACKRQSARYALAAFSAAARYAPAVRYQRVFAYVDADIDALAKALSLKPVDSGANVTLMEPYDQGVYLDSREIEGCKITSPPPNLFGPFQPARPRRRSR